MIFRRISFNIIIFKVFSFTCDYILIDSMICCCRNEIGYLIGHGISLNTRIYSVYNYLWLRFYSIHHWFILRCGEVFLSIHQYYFYYDFKRLVEIKDFTGTTTVKSLFVYTHNLCVC